MTTNEKYEVSPAASYLNRAERIWDKIKSLPQIWNDRPDDALGFAYGVGVMIKKNHPDAVIPAQAHTGDAGYDLRSVEDLVLLPGKFTAVDIGLSFVMEGNIELQIRPRSGLAFKNGVTVLNSPGTVDSQFLGPVKVILINHGDKPFEIKKGDRIAQGVFAFLPTVVLEEVAELPTSERGTGGFGSTGIK